MIEELKKLIADKLGIDSKTINEKTSIADDLKADSLDMVEITMCIEDKFGVKIPDEELGKFKTVGDIADFIATV